MQNCIWLKVTPDKYEFPLLIADTAQELANRMGISADTVKKQEKRHRETPKGCRSYKIVRVEV